MKIIYRSIITVIFLSLSSALMADTYQVYQVHKVETIPLKYELARKVIPVIRTFLSKHGHIAHLKGADYLIVKATPYSLERIREILSTVTLENFNAEDLRRRVSENLARKDDSKVTRVIKLNNLQAIDVVAAISMLVSDQNMTVIEGTNDLQITDSPDFIDEMTRLIRELDGF